MLMATDNNLEALDEFLLSLESDEAMLLSEFDGFCAGLVVCPEAIPPSEWLPHVWGSGGAPDFESEQELQRAIDLIMGHYNEVARSLTPPAIDYGPLFDQDPNTDDILWEMWVEGFEQAMRLRADAWEEVVASDDEEAASSVSLVLALHGIAEGTDDLSKKKAAKLSAEAPNLIVSIVLALNDWTKGIPSTQLSEPPWASNQFETPFQGKRVGRNEPCPCGSGRKYKRCCGAN